MARRIVLCELFLTLLAFISVAEDYRAPLEAAFELMNKGTVSYAQVQRFANSKYSHRLEVRQRRRPDGVLERIEEEHWDLGGSFDFPRMVNLYNAKGHYYLRTCDYFSQGILMPGGTAPGTYFLGRNSEVSGRAITTAEGRPGWVIVVKDKFRRPTSDEWTVDAQTHRILLHLQLDAHGKEISRFEYVEWDLAPEFTDRDFALPRRTKIYTVKDPAKGHELYKKLADAERKAVLKYQRKHHPEMFRKRSRAGDLHRKSLIRRFQEDPLGFLTQAAWYVGLPVALLCFAVAIFVKWRRR